MHSAEIIIALQEVNDGRALHLRRIPQHEYVDINHWRRIVSVLSSWRRAAYCTTFKSKSEVMGEQIERLHRCPKHMKLACSVFLLLAFAPF